MADLYFKKGVGASFEDNLSLGTYLYEEHPISDRKKSFCVAFEIPSKIVVGANGGGLLV